MRTARPSAPCRAHACTAQVCGVLTDVHVVSSKSGFAASGTSARMNFQPALKLYVARGDAGGWNAAGSAARPVSAGNRNASG